MPSICETRVRLARESDFHLIENEGELPHEPSPNYLDNNGMHLISHTGRPSIDVHLCHYCGNLYAEES